MTILQKASRWGPLWDKNDPKYGGDTTSFVVPDVLLSARAAALDVQSDELRRKPWGSSLERILDTEWRAFGAVFTIARIPPDSPPDQALLMFANAAGLLRQMMGGEVDADICQIMFVTDTEAVADFLQQMLEFMNEYPGNFEERKPRKGAAKTWQVFTTAARLARAPVAPPRKGKRTTNRSTTKE